MCGVAGLVALDGAPRGEEAAATVRAMLDALAHRGPDGEGIERVGPAVLGHRRLAIIDLAGGAQPIADASGRVTLVFNGEIYNYAALRDELAARGHAFRTRSDSEVLAAAVAEWGAGCLPRLRGMFAFVAWDAARGTLLLARDRLGKKPLYYAIADGVLGFASELPALLAFRAVDDTVDAAALAEYLRHGWVAAPRAMVRGARKLEAGSFVEIRLGAAPRVAPETYWDVRYGGPHTTRADAAREVLRLLDEAIADRLIADVPVGAFLSGGVDSTLIAARAARQRKEPLRTFTIGIAGESALDERDVARRVAALLGTTHVERVVDADAEGLLPTIERHLGEPLGDPSALPTYLVAQVARRDVKVVLTGDGGDETFAGYNRYSRGRLASLLGRLPRPLRERAAAALLSLGVLPSRLRVALERAARPAETYAAAMEVFGRGDVAALLHPDRHGDALRALDGDRLVALHDAAPADEALDRLLYTDLKGYLAEGVLTKVDRMTMACGVEARAPLLDHRLVELAARLPPSWKRPPGGAGKVLLREVAAGALPAWLLALPKRGFDLPVRRWMASGPLRRTVEGALRDSALARDGWLDGAALAREVAPGRDGAAPLGNRLWSLYLLELWYRRQRAARHSSTAPRASAQGRP